MHTYIQGVRQIGGRQISGVISTSRNKTRIDANRIAFEATFFFEIINLQNSLYGRLLLDGTITIFSFSKSC